MKSIIKEVIGGGAYWVVNKSLALKIGARETILLQQIIELMDYNKSEYIYRTVDNLVDDLGFSKHEIRTFKKKLQAAGLLEIEKRGIPAKHYMRINIDNLTYLLSTNTSSLKSVPLDSSGTNHNNTSSLKSVSLVDQNMNHLYNKNTVNKNTVNKNTIKKPTKKDFLCAVNEIDKASEKEARVLGLLKWWKEYTGLSFSFDYRHKKIMTELLEDHEENLIKQVVTFAFNRAKDSNNKFKAYKVSPRTLAIDPDIFNEWHNAAREKHGKLKTKKKIIMSYEDEIRMINKKNYPNNPELW